MARKDESLLNLLTRLPWWVGVILAAVGYLFLRFILPVLFSGNPILKSFERGLSSAAPIVALVLLVPAGVSAIQSWRRERMLNSQESIRTVGGLSWREFEELVSEFFRRQGYFVLENPGEGPDGQKGECLIPKRTWRLSVP